MLKRPTWMKTSLSNMTAYLTTCNIIYQSIEFLARLALFYEMSKSPRYEGEENHSDWDTNATEVNCTSPTTQQTTFETSSDESVSPTDNTLQLRNLEESYPPKDLAETAQDAAKDDNSVSEANVDRYIDTSATKTMSNNTETTAQGCDAETGEIDSNPRCFSNLSDGDIVDISLTNMPKGDECDDNKHVLDINEEHSLGNVECSTSSGLFKQETVRPDCIDGVDVSNTTELIQTATEIAADSVDFNNSPYNDKFKQNHKIENDGEVYQNEVLVGNKHNDRVSNFSHGISDNCGLKEECVISEGVCPENVSTDAVSPSSTSYIEALRKARAGQQGERSMEDDRPGDRPFRRGMSDKIKQMHDQLQKVVVFSETQAAKEERLKRQAAEVQEMSSSYQGKRRYQRSSSRSGRASSRSRRAAHPGKSYRPYRTQWTGGAKCVTPDSRFIISTKVDRPASIALTGDLTAPGTVAEPQMTNTNVDCNECRCSTRSNCELASMVALSVKTDIESENQRASLVQKADLKTAQIGSVQVHDTCNQKPISVTPVLSRKDVVSISYPCKRVVNFVDISADGITVAADSDVTVTKTVSGSMSLKNSDQILSSTDALSDFTSDVAKLHITDTQEQNSCKPNSCQTNSFDIDGTPSLNERREYKGSQTLPASMRLSRRTSLNLGNSSNMEPHFSSTRNDRLAECGYFNQGTKTLQNNVFRTAGDISAVKQSHMSRMSEERSIQRKNSFYSNYVNEKYPRQAPDGEPWIPYCSYRSTSPLRVSGTTCEDDDDVTDSFQCPLDSPPFKRFPRTTSRELTPSYSRAQDSNSAQRRSLSRMRRYNNRNQFKPHDGPTDCYAARGDDQYLYKAQHYRGRSRKEETEGHLGAVRQGTPQVATTTWSRDQSGKRGSLRRDNLFHKKRRQTGPKYITVRALQDYSGLLPGQLSFKAGQSIKLNTHKMELNDGLCYGYYRTGRLRKKKRGLFPMAFVEIPGAESEVLVTEL